MFTILERWSKICQVKVLMLGATTSIRIDIVGQHLWYIYTKIMQRILWVHIVYQPTLYNIGCSRNTLNDNIFLKSCKFHKQQSILWMMFLNTPKLCPTILAIWAQWPFKITCSSCQCLMWTPLIVGLKEVRLGSWLHILNSFNLVPYPQREAKNWEYRELMR